MARAATFLSHEGPLECEAATFSRRCRGPDRSASPHQGCQSPLLSISTLPRGALRILQLGLFAYFALAEFGAVFVSGWSATSAGLVVVTDETVFVLSSFFGSSFKSCERSLSKGS